MPLTDTWFFGLGFFSELCLFLIFPELQIPAIDWHTRSLKVSVYISGYLPVDTQHVLMYNDDVTTTGFHEHPQ